MSSSSLHSSCKTYMSSSSLHSTCKTYLSSSSLHSSCKTCMSSASIHSSCKIRMSSASLHYSCKTSNSSASLHSCKTKHLFKQNDKLQCCCIFFNVVSLVYYVQNFFKQIVSVCTLPISSWKYQQHLRIPGLFYYLNSSASLHSCKTKHLFKQND